MNADDFVFIRPDGSPINPNAVTLAFRRIIKRAGLKDIRIHDLRHTHATLMLKAGIHPKVVSELIRARQYRYYAGYLQPCVAGHARGGGGEV